MKKLLTLFAILLLSFAGYSQTCPTPTSSGVFVTIDSSYQLAPSTAGKTNVGLCYYNNSGTQITAVQFRVFYDNVAFSGIDTIVSLNTSFPQYLQYVKNQAGGYATVTLTYTGNVSSFSIPNGPLFKLVMHHSTVLGSTYLTVGNMTFTGTASFPQLATTQAGMDYVLNLYNFGGIFKSQTASYHGRFVNVTGSGAKNLAVAFEKKLKTGSTWTQVASTMTNTSGRFYFSGINVDTTLWNIRLAVKGDTMTIGNVISTSDAQKINQWVLGQSAPTGFDFYTADVNSDNNISISDAYGVFGRVSGRFTTWPNSTKDVKFFTAAEYASIVSATTSMQTTYPGVTNFTFNIIAGQPDSVTYYVCVPGDANGTGYKMARMVPIEIQNPNNATDKIIDVTTSYDDKLENMQLDFPTLSVDENSTVTVPVTVKTTDNLVVGSLQLAMKYDANLLEFQGVEINKSVATWMTYTNPNNGVVEWGGFDVLNYNKINNGDVPFNLKFTAKQPQSSWIASPLYVTTKSAGNIQSTDLNINPSNGIVTVYRLGQNLLADQMLIYPNPTSDFVTFKFKVEADGNVWLGIISADGKTQQIVVNQLVTPGTYNFSTDLGYLAAGEYVAVMKKGTQIQTAQVIKY
jgi:hypothetical protein